MIAALALALLSAPVAGERLSPFSLRTAGGAPYRWAPGRVTVLSFCAFWCDTWKDQLPRVQETMRITGGLPVEFATISVDGRWSERAKAVAVGTMLSDPGGVWSHAAGIDRVPYLLVVAPDGTIAWAGYGTVRTAGLVEEVRKAVRAVPPSMKRAYLTFDDFPSDHLSDELLDVLRAQGTPATFFCIGSKVSAGRTVVQRAAREGHVLGIHSWAHEGDRPELARCAAAIYAASGAKAELYRAPGSEIVQTLRGERLALPVDDPYDYLRPGVDELIRRVLSAARPNAVIQLHAGVQETIQALPAIIENLRRRGYRFEKMEPAS